MLLVLIWIAKDDSAGFSFLFDFPTDNHDTFMDYFNSVYRWRGNPIDGTYTSIYPPLTELGYVVLSKMLTPANSVGPFDLRAGHSYSTIITFSCTFIECVLYLSCAIVIHEILSSRGEDNKTLSWLTTGAVLMTLPFVYALERGNSIIVCFLAILIFLWAYGHEGRAWREVACITIAVAANIKVYPAVFLGMYLADRRFKEFWKAVLYSAVLFVVPFAAFGGFQSFLDMINNLFFETSNTMRQGFGQKVGLANLISFFLNAVQGTADFRFPNGVAVILLVALDLLVIILRVRSSKNENGGTVGQNTWRLALILGSSITLMPSFSYIYNGLFTLPGIVLLISDYDAIAKKQAWVLLCACLMTVLVIPFTAADITPSMTAAGQYIYPVNATHLMASIGYCVIYAAVLRGEVHDCQTKRERRKATN